MSILAQLILPALLLAWKTVVLLRETIGNVTRGSALEYAALVVAYIVLLIAARASFGTTSRVAGILTAIAWAAAGFVAGYSFGVVPAGLASIAALFACGYLERAWQTVPMAQTQPGPTVWH